LVAEQVQRCEAEQHREQFLPVLSPERRGRAVTSREAS
jgi:hypothetical protein